MMMMVIAIIQMKSQFNPTQFDQAVNWICPRNNIVASSQLAAYEAQIHLDDIQRLD